GNELTFDVALASIGQLSSVISGSGGLIMTGSGSVAMYADNSFGGIVQLNQGFVSMYSSNVLGSSSGGTVVGPDGTLQLINSMTVAEPLILFGTLRSLAGSEKTWTGPITLGDGDVTITVEANSPLTINAVISGSNGFAKASLGDLILNSNNTYTGLTTVLGGSLIVNGNQPNSPVLLNEGTIGGTGTIGTLDSPSGTGRTVSPGPVNSPGILTCNNLTLGSATFFQVLINGTSPGSGYQLNVNGTVALTNVFLEVTLGFTPSPSNS